MVGLGIQLEKMLQSFEMAVSCSWWMAVGALLITQERKLRVWTMWSPSLREVEQSPLEVARTPLVVDQPPLELVQAEWVGEQGWW